MGNPVAAVATSGAVPFLTDVLKRHAHTKSELTQVVNAITAWAAGDNLGSGLAVGLRSTVKRVAPGPVVGTKRSNDRAGCT